jgi:glycosyltransferase involved in cell wall biosynthesis
VEKGVDMLLRTRLAGRTGMRLFNNFRTRDPHRSLLERLRYQAGMVRSFRRELRRSAPDLVHVKTSSGINFCQNSLYVHLGRLARRPVLLQIHCGKFEAFYRSSSGLLRAWIRYTLTRARRVAVLSRFWQERIAILAPGARLALVPNGLEPEEMERLAGPMTTGPIQALFMGTGERQLNREKGLEELLSVLPALVADYPEVSWVLAGLESPDEAEAFWRERGLRRPPQDRVSYRGLVSGEERVRLIKESLLLVLPSHFENMPNLVLEAMAAGAAVAASSVGALPEMLGDSEGGFLFPPANAAALEAALRRALDEGSRLAHRGRRNREVVERDYTMAVVESRLEAIYLDLAGRSEAVSSHAGDLVGAGPGRSRAGRP